MSALKSFFKDTIIYGIAAVLPRAVNILLVKLHTHTLASEKYAENTLYFVYAAYFNALLTYGMETAFFRFFTKEKDKGKVLSTSFVSLLGSTLILMSALFYFSESIAHYFGFSDPLFLKILLLVITLDTLVVIPYAYLRVSNRPIRFMGLKVFNIMVFAFFNLFFLMYVPYALKEGLYLPELVLSDFDKYPLVLYIFLANLIASLATFLMLLPVLFKFKWQWNKPLFGKMLAYGLPIMVSSLAYVTNENLDKLLLDRYLGKEEMGIYAACYKLGVFMTLYIMAFKLGAEPFFFNHAKEENARQTYATVLNWFVIFGAMFMLVIVGFIDIFALLLLGDASYFSALDIVPVILLANLLLGIYYNLSIWFILTDRTRFGMYFSLIGAGITIAVNLVMIPRVGYMASAWATLMAYGIMALLSFLYGRKYYAVPYEVTRVLGLLGLTSLMSGISFFLFRGNYLVSALFVAALAMIIYWNQKSEIKELWNK